MDLQWTLATASNQYLIFLGDWDPEVTEGSKGPFVTFVEKNFSAKFFSFLQQYNKFFI